MPVPSLPRPGHAFLIVVRQPRRRAALVAASGTADSVLQLHTLKAAGNRTGGADRSEPQPLRLSAVLGPSQDDAQFSSPVLLPLSTFPAAPSSFVCCLPPRACPRRAAICCLIPCALPAGVCSQRAGGGGAAAGPHGAGPAAVARVPGAVPACSCRPGQLGSCHCLTCSEPRPYDLAAAPVELRVTSSQKHMHCDICIAVTCRPLT